MMRKSSSAASPLMYYRSVNGSVTLVGSNEPWEGFQAEIDFFTFHCNRFGQLMEWGDAKRLAYQADGNTFGIARESDNSSTDCTGVFASGALPLSEIIAELM